MDVNDEGATSGEELYENDEAAFREIEREGEGEGEDIEEELEEAEE